MSKRPSPIHLDSPDDHPDGVTRPIGRLIPFGWYGGKFNHLDWLLPLLPECYHYVEPFGGSASVILNRAPSQIETYNDIDGALVNFFRVLRKYPDSLTQEIALTPFSREEFLKSLSSESSITAIDRARLFYVRARQARTGLAQTASLGRWANCVGSSRSGMSGSVSRWLNGQPALTAVADRLLRVQIENRPAIDCIRRYDMPEALFYCDPPYPHDSRGDTSAYAHEFTDDQHRELASTLKACKGKVAVSGYRGKLMDRLYAGWRRVMAPPKKCHSSKDVRRETLWMNY